MNNYDRIVHTSLLAQCPDTYSTSSKNEKKKKDDSFGGLGMVTKWSVQRPKIIWDRSTASVYKNMYLGKFFVAPVH